jgi:hypothetical protein
MSTCTGGFSLVAPPRGFLVADVSGPLTEHQLEEAKEWGRKVAAEAQNSLAAASLR